MIADAERAARVLPNMPDGYRMQRRAMSRGVSRTTAAYVHASPGQAFYLSSREADSRRTEVHVAGMGVAP